MLNSNKHHIQIQIKVIKFLNEENYWITICPDFDIVMSGETEEEAEVNMKSAIEIFIQHEMKIGRLPQTLAKLGWEKKNNTLENNHSTIPTHLLGNKGTYNSIEYSLPYGA